MTWCGDDSCLMAVVGALLMTALYSSLRAFTGNCAVLLNAVEGR